MKVKIKLEEEEIFVSQFWFHSGNFHVKMKCSFGFSYEKCNPVAIRSHHYVVKVFV